MATNMDNGRSHRIGLIGALLTMAGVILSGPVSIALVSMVKPQPGWQGPTYFVEHFHDIQVLTFYFGFLLVAGSVLMIASIYLLSEDKSLPLLALLFTSIGAGMIFFNYIAQTTVIPALVEGFSSDNGLVISMLSMSNPTSITWALEMWGYGFLGLGTWLAAGFFGNRGIERAAKYLFVTNGVLSIAGALWTSLDLGWVLTGAGLAAFGLWNVLYFALALVFFLVLRGRSA